MVKLVLAFAFLSCALAQSLIASPSVLPSSGSIVTLTWSGANADDIIRVYNPAASLDKNFIGYIYLNETTGGSVSFPLVNMRTPYAFRLFTPNDVFLAESSNVTFTNLLSEPTQGHISLTGNPSEMLVMWTSGIDSLPIVQFGISQGQLNRISNGTSTTYVASSLCNYPATDDVNFRNPGFIHSVLLTGLIPATKYYYRFGSGNQFSSILSFESAPLSSGTVDHILYGDMGVDPPYRSPLEVQQPSTQVMKQILNHLASSNKNAMLLHIGDISYARGYAWIWEWFMALIQPAATQIPYMVAIGNHEFDFPQQSWHPTWASYGDDSGGECGVPYFLRFTMPQTPVEFPAPSPNLWFSYDHGPVHYCVMSTEHNFMPGSPQYDFIVNDLMNVDRSVTPWLIFAGHRPMYSSDNSSVYNELEAKMRFALQSVLIKYNVDIAIWGHVHTYERMCAMIGDYQCAEENDQGPIHIVIGNAGNTYVPGWYSTGDAHIPQPSWSIFRAESFGYSRLSATPEHLHWKFIGQANGEVHDHFHLMKKNGRTVMVPEE